MMSLQCFDGKNVIVAGVGGIGRASAVLLASLGAKIIMIDANESSMKVLYLFCVKISMLLTIVIFLM